MQKSKISQKSLQPNVLVEPHGKFKVKIVKNVREVAFWVMKIGAKAQNEIQAILSIFGE